MADVISTAIGAGGFIRVYTGSLGTDLDATGDTLLAEFNLDNPAAAAAVAGVADLDFAPDLTDTVIASGTAGYFHMTTSAGVVKMGGNVGTSGAAMNFDSVTWVAGGTVTLTTGTVTMPVT